MFNGSATSLPCCQAQVQQVPLWGQIGPCCCQNPAGCDLGSQRDEACSELHVKIENDIECVRSSTQKAPLPTLTFETHRGRAAGTVPRVLPERSVPHLRPPHPAVFLSASQSTGSRYRPAPCADTEGKLFNTGRQCLCSGIGWKESGRQRHAKVAQNGARY